MSNLTLPENRGRRRLLKALAGVGVLTAAAALQPRWTRPIIGSIVLPAHAQTSGVTPTQVTCEPFIGPVGQGSASRPCGSIGPNGIFASSALLTPNPGAGVAVQLIVSRDGVPDSPITFFTDVDGRVSYDNLDFNLAGTYLVEWSYAALSCTCSYIV